LVTAETQGCEEEVRRVRREEVEKDIAHHETSHLLNFFSSLRLGVFAAKKL
jgi:hypothetical protein